MDGIYVFFQKESVLQDASAMACHREISALVFSCGNGIFSNFYEFNENDAGIKRNFLESGGNKKNGNDNDTEDPRSACGA